MKSGPGTARPARRLAGALARSAAILAVLGAMLTALGQDAPSLAPGANPSPPPELPPGAAEVAIPTADGMRLAAAFWRGASARGAGVVLVHEADGDRTSWAPFVGALRDRGVAVLAIDLRGHGASRSQHGVDLGPLVAAGDPSLFREMHADAIAAVRWLAKDGKCDAKRIAVAGARTGASIALDATVRHPREIAVVACVSPPARNAALDNVALLAKFPAATPLLLLAADTDAEPAALELAHAASAGGATPQVVGPRIGDVRPAPAGLVHAKLLPQTLASFVAARTESKSDDVVLDGVVETQGIRADPWFRATRLAGGGGGQAWAYRVGRRLEIGGIAPQGCTSVRVAFQIDATDMTAVPHRATLDVATGSVRESMRDGTALPFTAGLPAARIVVGAAATTFEAEWMLPPAADGDATVRVDVRYQRLLDAEPVVIDPAKLDDRIARLLADRLVPVDGRAVPSR